MDKQLRSTHYHRWHFLTLPPLQTFPVTLSRSWLFTAEPQQHLPLLLRTSTKKTQVKKCGVPKGLQAQRGGSACGREEGDGTREEGAAACLKCHWPQVKQTSGQICNHFIKHAPRAFLKLFILSDWARWTRYPGEPGSASAYTLPNIQAILGGHPPTMPSPRTPTSAPYSGIGFSGYFLRNSLSHPWKRKWKPLLCRDG